MVVAAVGLVARARRIHPVRDYLQRLPWDETPRIDTWLEDFCAVAPRAGAHTTLVRAVARKWLIACVARAMTPGCKVDTMLILEGRQGIGKSSALAALASPRFFSDSVLDFASKEACQTIQGVWIHELAELAPLLRAETSSAKAFLTRAVDRFRAPYAAHTESIPRSVVFCGTVNHGGYLQDCNGNRRFWVVRCQGALDVAGLDRIRDQLWAEARVAFEAGETWHLEEEDEAAMREEHQDWIEVDPWSEALAEWTALQGDAPFTMADVLEAGLGLSVTSRNPKVTRRVCALLEELGFEKRRQSTGGVRSYVYVRTGGGALPYCPTRGPETCGSLVTPR